MHGFTVGDEIILLGMHGMIGINGVNVYVVNATTEKTISIQESDNDDNTISLQLYTM